MGGRKTAVGWGWGCREEEGRLGLWPRRIYPFMLSFLCSLYFATRGLANDMSDVLQKGRVVAFHNFASRGSNIHP